MLEGMDNMLQNFLVESQENLAQLDQQFVDLECHPDNQEILGSIFRTIHSIKGSAGFLKLPLMEQVSHCAEDVLTKLRNHSLELSVDLITTLLHAVDCLKSILVHLELTGQEGKHNAPAILEELSAALAGTPLRLDRPVPATEPAASDVRQESTGEPETGPQNVAQKAAEDQQQGPAQDERAVHAQQISATVAQAVSAVEDARIYMELGVLDRLLNLTGELVLVRNRLAQLAAAETVDLQAFRTVNQRVNVVISEVQETVMKTRMQPMQKVFGTLPRLIRELAHAQGKEVELHIKGQETELDRTLLEAIDDPLTQLVRNALEYGIESPEIRRQQGKSPTGTLTIKAYHEGGQVHIAIADDGAGIDLVPIKAKAISEGLMTAQQAEEASDDRLLSLLFRPGFSTAETVTGISGRGIGLDVVKQNLDRIGGAVEIHTELHQGATITLRIPITLAIIPALIVYAADQCFAIPQVYLEELIMPQSDDVKKMGIETVSGAEVYRLRGELLPLLRLTNVLQLPAPVAATRTATTIVVVSAGAARCGIIVDAVGNTEEIVVKPVSTHIKQLPCYDGATILGDGNVALILNVSGLLTAAQLDLKDLQQAEQKKRTPAEQAMEGSSHEQQQTIVLFRVSQDEYYGVPLAFVVRLEEFPASQIEHSGGREVLQYRGDILPLIRIEPCLHLPTVPDPAMLSLIVFSVEKQIGLVVTEVINTVEISTNLDTETFQQKGILGSTIVNGHAVLIVDIHGIIELAYPSWYKKFFMSKLSEEERRQIRVLLVEDSAFFLNIEKSYLESAGYQVVTATHGKDAVEILEKQPVDVVVTDIAMPYCDGYELTKIIKARAEWQHIPVMAVTVLSGDEDRRKGIEAGIDEYKIKLDRDDVLRALELLILRSRKS